jgi:hypothetical protein
MKPNDRFRPFSSRRWTITEGRDGKALEQREQRAADELKRVEGTDWEDATDLQKIVWLNRVAWAEQEAKS